MLNVEHSGSSEVKAKIIVMRLAARIDLRKYLIVIKLAAAETSKELSKYDCLQALICNLIAVIDFSMSRLHRFSIFKRTRISEELSGLKF